MSDRKIAITSLIFSVLGLFVGLFFGLRTEGLLRFEEWTWNTNKTASLLGFVFGILGMISTFFSTKRLLQAAEAKEEAERKAKEEAERIAKEEAERIAKEEAERIAKEEAERIAKEEAERKAKEEAEQKAKEEAERRAKEEAERKANVKDKEEVNNGMVKIGTSFLASVVSFHGGQYLVSVKYCGDNSLMVKEVKMMDGDICSISNANELKNIYLTKGRGFDVQLKRNTYSEENKSCVLIQCDYPEKILFNVSAVKIINGTNERDEF